MKTLVLGLALLISIVEASSLKSFLGSSSNNGFAGSGVMRMFMTSTTYDGNLGGVSGADAKCATRAAAAGLSGTYIAIVSTSTLNAKNRFAFPHSIVVADVKNNLIFQGGMMVYIDHSSGYVHKGYMNMPFGKYYTDFNPTNHYLYSGLNYDEFGTAIAGVTRAWTGTSEVGVAEAATCNNWTDGTAGSTGEYGVKNTTDTTWMTTNGTPVSCANVYRLICLQTN